MKKTQTYFLAFLLISSITSFAQIRVGGGVSVGVNIHIPIPDVVVVTRSPQPRNVPKATRPIIHTCDHICTHDRNYGNFSFGKIQNQNGSQGNYVFHVTNALLEDVSGHKEKIIYYLDTNEILELIISTQNPDDYNYHFVRNMNRYQGNVILAVLLNGQEIALNNGSLSLQPLVNKGFHSVINLHTEQEGSFNGTVNF
ncbi:hypothetical protein GCM10022393_38600 [Aquimarina addita]|uniref:Uncharacterized protein n=1 Tax=Aquimarina addita TaxID=870485 RepID=A0ABP6UT68_9FLAO